MWFKRILTVLTTLVAIALTLFVLMQVSIKADAAEVKAEIQPTEN